MCGQCGCHTHVKIEGNTPRRISIHGEILEKNDRLAERNRQDFLTQGVLVFNLLSSPGSGKTAFLQRTLIDLKSREKVGVIVGDLSTDNDARRLRESGVPAVQITTGNVCHLDAAMVADAVQEVGLDGLSLLFIENVGNLVCPVSYDLGEALRVVFLSVTEGEDKPLKYPAMFAMADVVIISKADLADAVEFPREEALKNIRMMAPKAKIFEVSARTGQGMKAWYDYLQARVHHDLFC